MPVAQRRDDASGSPFLCLLSFGEAARAVNAGSNACACQIVNSRRLVLASGESVHLAVGLRVIPHCGDPIPADQPDASSLRPCRPAWRTPRRAIVGIDAQRQSVALEHLVRCGCTLVVATLGQACSARLNGMVVQQVSGSTPCLEVALKSICQRVKRQVGRPPGRDPACSKPGQTTSIAIAIQDHPTLGIRQKVSKSSPQRLPARPLGLKARPLPSPAT